MHFYSVAFKFPDSHEVCWLMRSRCGIGFTLQREDRCLFESVSHAASVAMSQQSELALSGVSSRFVVVRI